MCRDTVSVGWDGRLYDCDFNQQLEMTMDDGFSGGESSSSSGAGDGGEQPAAAAGRGARAAPGLTVFDIADLAELTGRRVKVDNHCFGCTAGAGSSCGGATS